MSESSTQLTIPIGTDRVLALPGLGAAGYRWDSTVEGPPIVSVERVVATTENMGAMQPGRSIEERFRITGLERGETLVKFAQSRSFEPNSNPVSTREVIIIVF